MTESLQTPFCCGEVARATSVFIGALIRAAEIAGFDIEPKVTISNIERQMRRHMWYYITYLDLRTGEAQGPTPTLASRDFDIQLPYDVNDSELVSDTIPTQPQGTFRFTDSTFSLMRWHSYNLHRYLTISRINSRRGTASIPEIIANANVQKDWIKATFVNHFDDRIPIQRYAKLAGNLLVERLDTMLFYDGFLKQHATSLRPKVVTSCIDVAEQAVLMESDPELAIWEWSFGQFHQHQSIFWLISQYYQEPDLPERDRIMFVADHVFGSGPGDHNRCIEIMDAIKHQLNGFLRARGFAYRPANEAEKPLPDSATIAASSIGSDESPDDSASWDNWMLAPVSEDLSGGYGQGNWWLVPQAYADPNPANIYMDPSKEIQ